MDYCSLVSEALESLISNSIIEDIRDSDEFDNLVEVSFYDFDEFLSELESLKNDGVNFKKKLNNNFDENVKIIINNNKELLLIKFLDD